MRLDALLEPRNKGAPGARQPQAIGAAILSAAPLHQPPLFESIDHADHGRAVQPHRGREPALRDAGIRLEQQQDADAARRQRGDTAGEVAEYGALREAQPIAEQPGQDALGERQLALRLQNVLLTEKTMVARLRSLLLPAASATQ